MKKLPPKTVLVPGKLLDRDAVAAIIAGRLSVMSRYAKMVLSQVWAEELRRVDNSKRSLLLPAKSLLMREESMLSRESVERLNRILEHSHALATVYRYKQRLQAILAGENPEPGRAGARTRGVVPRGGRERYPRPARLRADAARLLPGAGLSGTGGGRASSPPPPSRTPGAGDTTRPVARAAAEQFRRRTSPAGVPAYLILASL